MKKKNKMLLVLSLATIVSIGGLSLACQQHNQIIEADAWAAPQSSNAGNYYDSVGSETGSALQGLLKSINSPKSTSYDWSRYEAADEAQDSTTDIISIYTRHNIKKDSHCGNYAWDKWNREHIWTQTAYPNSASDNHNIFACEGKINGVRSNYSFAEVSHDGTEVEVFGHKTGSYFANSYFEPNDAAKGEVARSVMYGTVQYSYTMTNIIKDIATALKWNIEHPVTDRDNYRNNTVYSLQGNRNPFTDHPEYACKIWGNTNDETKKVCSSTPVTKTLKLMVNDEEAGTTQNVKKDSTLTFYAKLDDVTTTDVTWSSSNEEVASVTSGTVLGLANGKSTITATYNADTSVKATCEVIVSDGKVTQINVTPTTKSLNINETAQFSAEVLPSTATDKTYTWSSSNETVADISTSGLVTSKAYGSSIIKATANDGSGIVGSAVLTVEEISSNSYKLVTDASQLVAGRKTAIVSNISSTALSSTQNANNRGKVDISIDSATSTFTTVDGLSDLTLEESTTNTGKYCFKTNDTGAIGYLAPASSSSNYLRTQAAIDDNSSFTISIAADGVAAITSVGGYTRNQLKYNSSASIFSCYASGQVDVSIYQVGGASPVEPSVAANTYATNFLEATANCATTAGSAWASQKSAFSLLSSEAKKILVDATYAGILYEDASKVQKCVWRYDLAVNTQGLENFMSRGGSASASQILNNIQNNNLDYSILIISLVGGIILLASFGTFIIIKKKRA